MTGLVNILIGLRLWDRNNHPREFLEAFKGCEKWISRPRNVCDKARTHLQRSSARRARTGILANKLEIVVVVILGTHQTGLNSSELAQSASLHLMDHWNGTRGNSHLAAQSLGHPASSASRLSAMLSRVFFPSKPILRYS